MDTDTEELRALEERVRTLNPALARLIRKAIDLQREIAEHFERLRSLQTTFFSSRDPHHHTR